MAYVISNECISCGSCETYPKFRRTLGAGINGNGATFIPSSSTVPSSARICPAISWSSVLFPAPLLPVTKTNSCCSMVRSISLTAGTAFFSC